MGCCRRLSLIPVARMSHLAAAPHLRPASTQSSSRRCLRTRCCHRRCCQHTQAPWTSTPRMWGGSSCCGACTTHCVRQQGDTAKQDLSRRRRPHHRSNNSREVQADRLVQDIACSDCKTSVTAHVHLLFIMSRPSSGADPNARNMRQMKEAG